jgi:hypothetical protein
MQQRRPGRPASHRESIPELANSWYLIHISKKYGLETREFLASFLDAWIHQKSVCGGVSIHCREKTENDGVFLVKQDQRIIAQLRL